MRPVELDGPGAPLGLAKVPAEVIISKSPDFDDGPQGGKVFIASGQMITIVHVFGQEWTLALPLEQILEAISAYTRANES